MIEDEWRYMLENEDIERDSLGISGRTPARQIVQLQGHTQVEAFSGDCATIRGVPESEGKSSRVCSGLSTANQNFQ